MRSFALYLFFAIALAGCGTIDGLAPKNRYPLAFEKDYLAVSRIITERIQSCVDLHAVRTELYPATRSARVFIAGSGAMGSVYDIRESGAGKTVADFYPEVCLACTNARAQRQIQRVRHWIDVDSTECWPENSPVYYRDTSD